MPKKWKPDKAHGSKRENKQRLERQQSRKDFAKNMHEAEALVRDYEMGLNTTLPYVGDLPPKFVDWALGKYRHDKYKEEMSKQHQDMSRTWSEILVTAEACAKATEARLHPKRMEARKSAAARFRKRKREEERQCDLR